MPSDFGGKFPSDSHDVMPVDPSTGAHEIDYIIPKLAQPVDLQRVFTFEPDLQQEQGFVDVRNIFYGVILGVIETDPFIKARILLQTGKVVEATAFSLLPGEEYKVNDPCFVTTAQAKDEYHFVGQRFKKEVSSIVVARLADQSLVAGPNTVGFATLIEQTGEDFEFVGDGFVKVLTGGLYEVEGIVTTDETLESSIKTYGGMYFTSDSDLDTATLYPFSLDTDNLVNVTFGTNSLTVAVEGDYQINFDATVSLSPPDDIPGDDIVGKATLQVNGAPIDGVSCTFLLGTLQNCQFTGFKYVNGGFNHQIALDAGDVLTVKWEWLSSTTYESATAESGQFTVHNVD